METTKQKLIVDTQKIKKSKHTTTENHQITKKDSERGRKLQNSQKTMNKMAIVSLYLLIITLKLSGLNYPMKDRVA